MFNYFLPKKYSLTQWAWYLLVMQLCRLLNVPSYQLKDKRVCVEKK